MKQQNKSDFIGSVIGLFIVYILLGVMLHFVFDYDLLKTTKILVSVTILMGLVASLISAIVWFIFYVVNKIKQ